MHRFDIFFLLQQASNSHSKQPASLPHTIHFKRIPIIFGDFLTSFRWHSICFIALLFFDQTARSPFLNTFPQVLHTPLNFTTKSIQSNFLLMTNKTVSQGFGDKTAGKIRLPRVSRINRSGKLRDLI